MDEGRSSLKILTDKHTVKRPFGRSWRRCEGNMRMELTEICINTRNLVDSAKDMDYWGAFFECCIQPPGFRNHGIS